MTDKILVGVKCPNEWDLQKWKVMFIFLHTFLIFCSRIWYQSLMTSTETNSKVELEKLLHSPKLLYVYGSQIHSWKCEIITNWFIKGEKFKFSLWIYKSVIN